MTENYSVDTSGGFSPRLLPSIVVVLISALAVPFASDTYVSLFASGICSVFIIATARKKISAMLLILILVGTFGLPSGLPMITVILALIVGTGTFSWLIVYTRSPYLAIIPVLAYSVTTVITKNWFGSLLAAIFAIPALMLAVSFMNGSTRLGAICKTTAAFSLTVVAGVILAMLYFRGEIRLDVMREYARQFTDSFAKVFSGIEIEMPNGQLQPVFSESDSYNLALQIVTLSPALTVLFFNVITFFAQRLQFVLVRSTMGDKLFSPHTLAFIVSPGAGIVFVLSSVVSTFTNSTPAGYAVNTICQNLTIILAPALIGTGIMYFFVKLAEKRMKMGPLIIFVFIFLLIFNFPMALLLVACLGAYASVAIPLIAVYRANTNDGK